LSMVAHVYVLWWLKACEDICLSRPSKKTCLEQLPC